MINAKSLLDSFLGQGRPGLNQPGLNQPGLNQPGRAATPYGSQGPAPGATQGGGSLMDQARAALGQVSGGSFAGGAAAGGILGMVLGGKSMRKLGGSALTHGGAAVLGALAHRAWQNWQQGQAPASAPLANTGAATPAEARDLDPRFIPGATPAADGQPFELALIRAMIGAAKADGHVDATERARIFERVEEMGLDPEAKAFLFDALDQDMPVAAIAATARTPEQAAELYLAARMVMDPDQAAERAWLGALAHRLRLDPGLAAHLDRQAEAAAPPAA